MAIIAHDPPIMSARSWNVRGPRILISDPSDTAVHCQRLRHAKKMRVASVRRKCRKLVALTYEVLERRIAHQVHHFEPILPFFPSLLSGSAKFYISASHDIGKWRCRSLRRCTMRRSWSRPPLVSCLVSGCRRGSGRPVRCKVSTDMSCRNVPAPRSIDFLAGTFSKNHTSLVSSCPMASQGNVVAICKSQ